MRYEFCQLRRTGGGFVYGLKDGIVESIGIVCGAYYAREQDLGAIDAPECLPGGATRIQPFPVANMAFVTYDYVPRSK